MSKSIKMLILTAFIIAFAFICMFTNPTEEAYISWAKETYSASFNSEEASLPEIFTHIINANFMSQATTSKNFVFFTIFETTLDHEEFKVIGLLNNFFPISSSAATS